jgi:hypothetical protein
MKPSNAGANIKDAVGIGMAFTDTASRLTSYDSLVPIALNSNIVFLPLLPAAIKTNIFQLFSVQPISQHSF